MIATAGNDRLYYRAKEAAQLLGISLRTVYEGIYAGWIPSRKIGNSRLIPAAWLKAATDEEAAALTLAERATSSHNIRYYFGNRPRMHAGRSRLLQRPAVASGAISSPARKSVMLALRHGCCSTFRNLAVPA